jgi:hypothetical protein
MKVKVGEFGHGATFDFSRHMRMGKRPSRPKLSPLRKSRLKLKLAQKSPAELLGAVPSHIEQK